MESQDVVPQTPPSNQQRPSAWTTPEMTQFRNESDDESPSSATLQIMDDMMIVDHTNQIQNTPYYSTTSHDRRVTIGHGNSRRSMGTSAILQLSLSKREKSGPDYLEHNILHST